MGVAFQPASGFAEPRNKDMTDYHRYRDELRRYGRTGRSTGERLRDYLRTRSTEAWMFFAAGLILGALIG